MKLMKLIPEWQDKNLVCDKCGETRSVKYEYEVTSSDGCRTYNVCNSCALKYDWYKLDLEFLVVKMGNLKAEWSRLGEGLSGDYNPNDPEDVELLRFDVSYLPDGEENWEAVPDASYCTRFPVDACYDLKLKALNTIICEYYDACSGNYNEFSPSVKRLGERLSWICPEDFN